MNWITKIIKAGEKIKTAFHERASKEDIAKSDWTSCCKGPILKKDLEENLWVCPSCSKHHRIKPSQRFDILFGKNNYEIFKTPIPIFKPNPNCFLFCLCKLLNSELFLSIIIPCVSLKVVPG